MTQPRGTSTTSADEPPSDRRPPEAEELRAVQQQVQVYAELQQLLVHLANRLVALPAERLFSDLTEVLHQLADAVDADRVMLILFDEREGEVSCHAEWHRDTVPAAMPLMQKIPIPVVTELFEPLQSGRLVLVEDLRRLPREHFLARMASHLGLFSAIMVPLTTASHVLGTVSVGARDPRCWPEQHQKLLQIAGQLIGNTIQRCDREARLREREAELDATLEATPDGVLVLGAEGQLIHANRRFFAMFHLPEPLPRMTPWAVLRERMLDAAGLELAEAFAAATLPPGGPLARRWSPPGGRTVEVRHHDLRRDGRAAGQVWTFRDITDQLALEGQLRQAQKMESVGLLAGGIAHDFNNILHAIGGISELLLMQNRLAESARSDIEEIQRAATQAASLTRQLMAFSRKQVLEVQVLDLNRVVDSMRDLLRRLVGEDVELCFSLRAKAARVKADLSQLQQIVMNLASNGRDAMPEGGRLLIETADGALEADGAETSEPVVPGPHAVLTIRDTGRGMDAETVARAFEPFFTTKPLGQGTGLGLATVYGIVRQHGGHVTVHSEPDVGTTFRIFLPVTIDAPVPAERQAPVRSHRGEGQLVLVVEDEPVVRERTAQMLREGGYRVLTAADGVDALRVVAAHDERIDVMITDVVMPRMGGPALYDALRKRDSALRVLYVSGYPGETIAHHGFLREGVQFLQKPFSWTSLLSKLAEILASPREPASGS